LGKIPKASERVALPDMGARSKPEKGAFGRRPPSSRAKRGDSGEGTSRALFGEASDRATGWKLPKAKGKPNSPDHPIRLHVWSDMMLFKLIHVENALDVANRNPLTKLITNDITGIAL
jgi:hypothetical protein